MPGRAWRTFLLKLWGHEVTENAAAVPDTMAAIGRIPGVHSALFSILAGRAEIEPHRGSAAGIIRFHYPLIVPKEPEKCWIEIGGHHFFWKEGEPLVFDDTREHWVKNQTDETRVVLIIDFNAPMPFPMNLYTGLRYNLVRRSTEIKTVIDRASIGVPPRALLSRAGQGCLNKPPHPEEAAPRIPVSSTAVSKGGPRADWLPILRDARLRRAPQDEGICSDSSPRGARRSCRETPGRRSGPGRRG